MAFALLGVSMVSVAVGTAAGVAADVLVGVGLSVDTVAACVADTVGIGHLYRRTIIYMEKETVLVTCL